MRLLLGKMLSPCSLPVFLCTCLGCVLFLNLCAMRALGKNEAVASQLQGLHFRQDSSRHQKVANCSLPKSLAELLKEPRVEMCQTSLQASSTNALAFLATINMSKPPDFCGAPHNFLTVARLSTKVHICPEERRLAKQGALVSGIKAATVSGNALSLEHLTICEAGSEENKDPGSFPAKQRSGW